MNLGEYRTEVRERLGIPVTDTQSVPEATLDRAINGALRHVSNERSFPWLFDEVAVTVAAGTDGFALPVNWQNTAYVATDKDDLPRLTLVRIRELQRRDSGRLHGWAIEGVRIVVGPKPTADVDLTHGYYRIEPTLVAPGDVALLPDVHSDWAINEAGIRLAVRANKADRLQDLRQEAEVAKRRTLLAVARSEGPIHIKRTNDRPF